MNNKIQTYIAELIGSHDCVIIPGFGAFISQPTSADIHRITNKFSPPGRTIGFNGQIKINDGLLASFICTAEDVTFQEANTLIEEFVKHFNNSIHLFKSFEIKEVGRFFYNLEGKLEFEPDYHHDFSSDSFGLTEFVFKPIERNTFDMNQPSQHRNSKTASSKTSVKKNKEETGEESNSSSAFGKILLVAMPFLVLIGAFFVYNQQKDVSLGGINLSETLGLKKHEVVADTTAMAPDSVAVAETVVENTELVEEQPVVEEAPEQVAQTILEKNVKNNSAVLSVSTDIQPGDYYIVVGSFKEEKNADRMFNKLTKKNETVVKIPVDAGGFYKVAFGGYDSKESALSELETLGVRYNGLWIKKY